MSIPDFSILIRTTGRRQELANALSSVSAQTLSRQFFEVVLINDGGPSVADLADNAQGTIDVKLVEHRAHLGKSGAINSGFEHSRGRYLCILDDDDLYYPTHLEVLQEALSRDPAALILYTDTDVALVDEDGTRRIIGNQAWEFDQSELMMMHRAPIACSMCIRRDAWSAVGGFDEQFTRVLDDWDFYMRLAQRNPFHRVPQTTTQYTQPTGNKTFERFPGFEAGLGRIRSKLAGSTTTLQAEFALDSALDRLRRDYMIAVRDLEIEELRNQAGLMPQDSPLESPLVSLAIGGSDGTATVQALGVTTFTVEIGNCGTETWFSNGGLYPIHLSYHWTSDECRDAVWDGVRTPLPCDVSTGDRVLVRILVHCPERPGVYYWSPAVVQEGVQWIDEYIDETGPAKLVVRVQD